MKNTVGETIRLEYITRAHHIQAVGINIYIYTPLRRSAEREDGGAKVFRAEMYANDVIKPLYTHTNNIRLRNVQFILTGRTTRRPFPNDRCVNVKKSSGRKKKKPPTDHLRIFHFMIVCRLPRAGKNSRFIYYFFLFCRPISRRIIAARPRNV